MTVIDKMVGAPAPADVAHPLRPRIPLSIRVVAPLLLGAVLLIAWWLAATLGSIPKTLLPHPAAVASRFVNDLANGQLLAQTAVTLGEAVAGSLVAVLVALPVGWLIAHSRVVEAALSPYLAASQAIPAIALAPLLVIWVGYGLTPITLLCALLVFFPVVLAAVLGLRTLDRDLIEAAQLDGAHGVQLIRYLEWPLARAAVMTGIRNGFTLSITGAVVGEFVMGGNGLGMVLSSQSASVDTTGLFATLVMLCLLAVIIYLVLLAIERATDPLAPVRHPSPTGIRR